MAMNDVVQTESRFAVCGILVTFNPDVGIGSVIEAALHNLDALIVIDNCSKADVIYELQSCVDKSRRSLKDKSDRLYLVLNDRNVGIAKAFNLGIRLAIDRGYPFVIFLDQDSQILEGTIRHLKDYYDALTNQFGNVVLTCNNVETNQMSIDNFLLGYYHRLRLANTNGASEIIFGINSGLFLKVSIFHQIGFFDERYFVDGVDHEFFLRLRKNSIRVFMIKAATIQHEVGRTASVNWARTRIVFRVHSKERYYYIFRETPKTVVKYAFTFPSLCMLLSLNLVFSLFKAIFFFKGRIQYLLFMSRGLVDFVRNVSGSLDST